MLRFSIPAFGTGEIRTVEFDFGTEMEVGETIPTATMLATVYSGTDASPQDIVSGSTSSAGPIVTQLIDASLGVSGVTYLLTCTAITSEGQELQSETYVVIL